MSETETPRPRRVAPQEAAGTPDPAAPPRPVPRRKPQIGDTRPAPPTPAGPPGPRHGGRGAGGPGRADGAPAPGRGGGGSRGRDSPGRRRRGSTAVEEPSPDRRRERRSKQVGRYLVCVHVQPQMTQIAMLEGRSLVEHYVSRAADDTNQIDGNVYRGRVQNVLPGMEAAFIDIGIPKNAVLYRGDVRYDREDIEGGSAQQPRIEDVLKAGQTILCQVTKNPIGAKGARLTQEVSLPGRFAVLVPNSSAFGISKRLGDTERRRLRRIIDDVKPAGHGMIVRTAAEGVSADELRRDVDVPARASGTPSRPRRSAPTPRACSTASPTWRCGSCREELNSEYRGVVIDDLALYEQVRDYVRAVSPELSDRVEYYDPEVEGLPIFERYHVHEQLHKALDRKVWLPVGGLADHRADRGADRDRREHGQERRQDEPGGDGLPQQPRGGRGGGPPAAAARHRRASSSSTSSTWRSGRTGTRWRRPCATPWPGTRPGPRSSTSPSWVWSR